MEYMRLIAGPVIGAVIGYCTNLIAVKMLFYPRRELRVLGHRVPLTPGAIPKGKDRLARAVGTVVENHLLTREDIESRLLSPEAEARISAVVSGRMQTVVREALMGLGNLSPEDYAAKRRSLCEKVSGEVIETIRASGVTETLLRDLGESLREKAKGSMLHLLVNHRTLDSVMDPLQSQVDRLLEERGAEYLTPVLEDKLREMDGKTARGLLEGFGATEDSVTEALLRAYRSAVAEYAQKALSELRIAEMIEGKIRDMSVSELEQLVLSVMKKELDAIVRLGALIGFVLGLLTALF